MAAINKSTKIKCWKCGSNLHDSAKCGITMSMIRSGKVVPFKKIKFRRRKCAYCDRFGKANEMVLLPTDKVYRSECHFAHQDCYHILVTKSRRVIKAQVTTFGQIKKGRSFLLNGREWKRMHGIFALPVAEIGTGQSSWPIKLNQRVIALNAEPNS